MRLTIKAIGFTVALLWIITLTLPVSVTLSLLKLAEGKNLGIKEPTFTFTNGNLSLTMPFYINNTGFYDISEAKVQVKICKANIVLAEVSKTLPEIQAGQTVEANCSFTASLEEVFQKDRTLLTEDADLNVNATLHFRVAYLIAFNIASVSATQWGAPFHNLTVYGETYNKTSHVLSFYVSFNNHASFPLEGSVTVSIINLNNETIGATSLNLNVQPGEAFLEHVEVAVNPQKMTNSVLVRLSLANLEILRRLVQP